MLDRAKVTLSREAIAEFIARLTGSPDTSMCWRFLPEAPTEKAKVQAHEKHERERRRVSGDPAWK